MICPSCGSTLEDNIRFCPNCGKPVSAPGAYAHQQPVGNVNSIGVRPNGNNTTKIMLGVVIGVLVLVIVIMTMVILNRQSEISHYQNQIKEYENRNPVEKSVDAVGSWIDELFD